MDQCTHHPDPAQGPFDLFLLIARELNQINRNLETIMATIDQLVTDVNEESTLEESVITLLNGIKQQLTEALSGANLPPAVQAKVDAAFSQLEANKAKLADALTANTPAADA